MSKFLYCCLLLIAPFQWASAQNDDINYDKFFHTSLGGGYGEFGGEIGDRLSNTTVIGTSLGAGISRNASINLNFYYHFTNIEGEGFSLDPGAVATERPDILNAGLGYHRIFGTGSKSHFHGQAGIGFSWLGYQDPGSGMKGFISKLELGWALLIKSKAGPVGGQAVRYRRGGVRIFDVRSGSGLTHYRPVMANTFIDFFVTYNYMNLNNQEGKGHLIFFGARYKKIVYSEAYIPGENDF